MPTYLSPGVYVEEVPPLARPIAGVGTSTAGFIGVVDNNFTMPDQPGKFESLLRFESQFELKRNNNGDLVKDEDNFYSFTRVTMISSF